MLRVGDNFSPASVIHIRSRLRQKKARQFVTLPEIRLTPKLCLLSGGLNCDRDLDFPTSPKQKYQNRVPRSHSKFRWFLPTSHNAFNAPGEKVNSTYIAEWLVSPGVRSTYQRDGATIVDITHGLYYTLNRFAARVWATIETSPSGIAVGDIVDVLETHFDAPREELETDAVQCLADLRSAGLAGERVAVSNEIGVDLVSASSEGGAWGGKSGHEGSQIMLFEGQFVQRFESVESLVGQLFREGLRRDVDWRAKKLKDFIDDTPGKINGRLRDVCNQLELSLSERQARRLFKDSTGISVREYARKRRLAVAAKRLHETNEPIKVIATDAAYRTVQGFEKGFYAMFRLTPMEFRKMWHRINVTA